MRLPSLAPLLPCALGLLLAAAPVRAQDLAKARAQLASPSAAVRYGAVRALADLGAAARTAVPDLLDRLDDPAVSVRVEAARALVRVGLPEKSFAPVAGRLGKSSSETAVLLAEALAQAGRAALPTLQGLLASGDVKSQEYAATALSWMGPAAAPAVPALLDAMESGKPGARDHAAAALRRLAPWASASVAQLTAKLQSKDGAMRGLAAWVLGRIGPDAKSAIPALEKLAKEGEGRDKTAAGAALARIRLSGADEGSGAAGAPAKEDKTAGKTAQDQKALLDPRLADKKAPDLFRVKFQTTKGAFVVEAHRDWAPLGVDRFYNLVKIGFFKDVEFFRVIQSPRPFVVQFGINGDPHVSGAWRDASFADDPVKQTNARGTLTFATAGPNTRTTQFFINLGDNKFLDRSGFAPIGKVVAGMDVVDSLYGGYGEAPSRHQMQIQTQGNDFLKANYPKLDSIQSAEILKKK